MSNLEKAGYGALIIINMACAALAIEVGAGRAPIPAEWQWLVPVIVAVLTGLTMLLPKAGERK